jgi:hypothetical protein
MNHRAGATRSFIACILVPLGTFAARPGRTIAVSGDVSGAWTSDLSPVVVTGDCRIASGASLLIGPGVRVLLSPGTSLEVDGDLRALGTPDQPIALVAAAPLVGPWRAVAVSATGAAFLENCVLRGGGMAQPTELMGTLTVEGGSLTLRDCEISASDSNGVYLRTGRLSVEATRFSDNGGARPTDAGLHIASGSVVISGNPAMTSIEGSPFGVYNEDLVPVTAGGVWWGSATGPQHATNILGLGVSVSDDVLYAGFATQSPNPATGDVNMDGMRDLQDVAALARIAAGITAATPTQIRLGDLYPDGSLDLSDALALSHAVLMQGP